MEAVVVTEHGGPEVLQLQPLELGPPGASQVRVRVEAAGVNFIDIYLRSGQYPSRPPYVAGLEGAGQVEALG